MSSSVCCALLCEGSISGFNRYGVEYICGAIITSSSSALLKVVEYLNINDVLFSSTEIQWP